MGSYSVDEGNPVTNEADQWGWRYVEASRVAPYRRTNEAGLREQLNQRGRVGQTLNEYVVAAQMSKSLTGHYLDEDTWSRLFGSRGDGRVVAADFDADGYLYVYPNWDPQERDGDLGGRSSEGV